MRKFMQNAEPINSNKVRQETTDWKAIIKHLKDTKGKSHVYYRNVW